MKKHPQPAKSKMGAYLELSKPRILSLVLVSTVIGFVMGSDSSISWIQLGWTLFGTGLTAAGAGALNHYFERNYDTLMERTKNRPIPAGILSPAETLLFGTVLVLIGSAILVVMINPLTGFLSILTAFLYNLVYTPLKRMTWLNTSIGSIPGKITAKRDSGCFLFLSRMGNAPCGRYFGIFFF